MNEWHNCTLHSYRQASECVDSNGGSRKIANNTYAERLDGGSVGIKYHKTYIVTWFAGGGCNVNSGGWHTKTTKERINRYLPEGWSLYSDPEWWLVYRCGKIEYHTPFRDHVVVFPNGDFMDSDRGHVEVTASGVTGERLTPHRDKEPTDSKSLVENADESNARHREWRGRSSVW